MSKVSGVTAPAKIIGKAGVSKVSGVEFAINVPEGLIVILTQGSVPTGWTRFSAADNRFIIGASATKAPNSTGDPAAMSHNTTSDTAGAHAYSVHSPVLAAAGGSGSYYSLAPAGTAGSHSHTVSVTSFTPKKKNIVLIQADGNYGTLPSYSGGFNATTLSGYTVLSADGFFSGSSSVSDVSATVSGSISSSGGHVHAPSSYYQSGSASAHHVSGGAHDHEHSLAITYNFNHIALRALYKALEYIPDTGLIAMWEGTTAPEGWILCDGSGGTPDLRNYFVLVLTSADGTVVTGTTVDIVDTLTSSWSHSHYGGTYAFSATTSNRYNNTGEASHSHSVTFSGISYTPPYYALTFIQRV